MIKTYILVFLLNSSTSGIQITSDGAYATLRDCQIAGELRKAEARQMQIGSSYFCMEE